MAKQPRSSIQISLWYLTRLLRGGKLIEGLIVIIKIKNKNMTNEDGLKNPEGVEPENDEQRAMSEALQKMAKEETGQGQNAEGPEKPKGLNELLESLPEKPKKEEIERLIPKVAEELRKIYADEAFGAYNDEQAKKEKDMKELLWAASFGGLSEEQVGMTRVSKSDKKSLDTVVRLSDARFTEMAAADVYEAILKKNGLL
jgi:hypothetical protein